MACVTWSAGALRDYGRAVIIGERTFGKGLVQYYFPMGDGSGLKLTVAKYLTPKSYDISKDGGLNPDIRCKDYPHGELMSAAQPTPQLNAAAHTFKVVWISTVNTQ